jgi:hypothetical protein
LTFLKLVQDLDQAQGVVRGQGMEHRCRPQPTLVELLSNHNKALAETLHLAHALWTKP